MRHSVYIDNNVWDHFFRKKINVIHELPPEEFAISITPEVKIEIESEHTPLDLRNFVRDVLETNDIRTDFYFGFGADGAPPEKQRVAGFDQGRFISYPEIGIMQKLTPAQDEAKGKPRKTGLGKNEADIALAMRSVHSIVLTFDKSGPLKRVREDGGKVVSLEGFENSGVSLKEYIIGKLQETEHTEKAAS